MTTDDTTADPATVLGGRYVLAESVGRGGMAEVFRARDTTLDRDVAIKVFHQHSAMPDSDVRRSSEVRLLASLSHPGLVTVFDAGRDTSDPADPFAYLVMELVDGTTLAKTISGGPVPRGELSDIAEQLAAALVYVHDRGVVHRDIKPANVLLSGPNRSGRTTAKLTDFGVAQLVDTSRLTLHGTTVGTANYLSPEQTTGARVTAASDIYSFGLVLLEALTGQMAYPGYGVEAAVVRLHRAPSIPAWVNDGWRELLTDMTAFEPGARPDAAAVEARLRLLRRDTAPTAVLARRVSTPTDHNPRRPLWIAFALAVAATIIAVVLGIAGDTHTSGGTALPNYPSVPGALGTHLRALEADTPAPLRDDVFALARAAAAGNRTAAGTALTTLSGDLAGLQRSGQISPAKFQQVSAAISVVSHDLAAARQVAVARSSAARASAAAARSAAASRSAARAAASRSAANAAASASAAAARTTSAPGGPGPGGPPGQDKGPKPGKRPGKGHGGPGKGPGKP